MTTYTEKTPTDYADAAYDRERANRLETACREAMDCIAKGLPLTAHAILRVALEGKA